MSESRSAAGTLTRSLKHVYLVSGDEPLTVGECADAIRAAAKAAGYAERSVFFIERGFSWDELRHSAQRSPCSRIAVCSSCACRAANPTRGRGVLEIAAVPPPDTLTLIVTDKLDSKTSEAPWVRAVEKHGAWIQVWPVRPMPFRRGSSGARRLSASHSKRPPQGSSSSASRGTCSPRSRSSRIRVAR